MTSCTRCGGDRLIELVVGDETILTCSECGYSPDLDGGSVVDPEVYREYPACLHCLGEATQWSTATGREWACDNCYVLLGQGGVEVRRVLLTRG